MDKMEIYRKAIELCVTEDPDTGRSYIEPLWREILETEGIEIEQEDESRVFETLELAVKKADAISDNTRIVMDWLYDLITAQVNPAMLQEENDYIKNVMEYMKLNDSLKDKEKELAEREDKADKKEEVYKMFPQMNFNRR